MAKRLSFRPKIHLKFSIALGLITGIYFLLFDEVYDKSHTSIVNMQKDYLEADNTIKV